MNKLKFFIALLASILISLSGFSQTVNSPLASSYAQSTTNQSVSGFSVSGFNTSSTLLVTIGLVNPPSGTTLRLATTGGITASTGYSLTSNFTRISFTGTQANINTVLSSLRLNTGSVPGNVYIAVTATVNPTGFFYLPSNGHFYRPISSGATYTNARAAALNTTFKGQQGYLVTITSADEDAFIFNNVPQSQIWFALTDEAVEGQWRIDAGPEAGTLIKTSNGQFTGNIAGQYNNWAPGEPNNSGNEDYAVTKWNGSKWNDLPNNFSCPYVIEYGTWTDPADQTFTDFFTGFVTHQIACSPATSPSAPTVTSGSRLNAGTVTLSAVAPSGSTVDWYANATGGNVLSGGLGVTTFTTPSLSNTTTYYVQSRNTSTGCVSSTRTAVTATVNYPTPFTYSGFILNTGGAGVPNISVQLFTKLKSQTSYTLFQTYNTNSSGVFSISTALDINDYDFRVVINNLNIALPTTADAIFFNDKIFTGPSSSIDWYQMNINGNDSLTISDVYLIYKKINGSNWPINTPSYRLFTQSEWNTINTLTGNLTSSYPGQQSITLTNPTAGSSSTFYLIRTGKTD
jgi:hypothetical protein